MKKHALATKTLTKITSIWTSYFGVLKYCTQSLTMYEDNSVIIKFNLDNSLLSSDAYDKFINEVEEYLFDNGIKMELMKDETLLTIIL